jgi:hypothetical protein
MGFRPSLFIMRSLIITAKAAPSLVCEELPAVTEPPCAKAGFNLARASMLVSAQAGVTPRVAAVITRL